MRAVRTLAVTVGVVFLLSGCFHASGAVSGKNGSDGKKAAGFGASKTSIRLLQLEKPKEGQMTVIFTTTYGSVTAVLYPKEAPKTVAHFTKLVQEGFYDNKPVFRQRDSEFLISGALNGCGTKGKIATSDGQGLKSEATQNLWHFSGALSTFGDRKSLFSTDMAVDSRFFIVGHVDPTTDMMDSMKKYHYPDKVIRAYQKLGGLPQYANTYTVFGQVIHGMGIVDQMIELTNDNPSEKKASGPVIQKVRLSTYHRGDPMDAVVDSKEKDNISEIVSNEKS